MSMAYRTKQRTGTTADIAASGTCFGAGTIEASFNGGTYADLDTSIDTGAFSGTLSAQAQGQGTFTARMKSAPLILGTAANVGIGDVFGVAGQSNAMGAATNSQVYSHATLKAAIFKKNYTWGECLDPIDGGTCTDAVEDNSGVATGSIWPLIATSHMASQGVPCAFVPCARDATAIASWAPGADHQDRTTLYGSMVYRCLQAGGVKAVLWWQGESDSIAGTAKATYKTALQTLGDAVFSDLGCSLVACRHFLIDSGTATLAHQTAICDAISESWGTHHILAGPDLHVMAGDGADTMHYKTDATTLTTAGLWWTAMLAALYP